ncbi:hypothetical protein V5052_08825 [Klebsiella variicola]|uniref:hypothetical protein n=1 Tax=Klebsiella variicola TaxID=244366 RepID=UPI00317081FF
MATINETKKWEDDVYQVSRGDKVQGGRGGIANLQAGQLANRTSWLKAKIDSFNDALELTFYKTDSDPDGTIAGMSATTGDDVFRVAQGPESSTSFVYYLNDDGRAVAIADMPGTASVKGLAPLRENTEYSYTDQYDDVTTDSEGNILRYIDDGKEHHLMPTTFSELDAAQLKVGGVNIDPEGSLTAGVKKNIEALSDTTDFEAAGEFRHNPRQLIWIDEDNNIILDPEEINEKMPAWDAAAEKVKTLAPQEFNPLVPFSQRDSNGISQIRVYNTETKKETAVTTGSSNETAPRPDGLDRIVWQSDRADDVPGGVFFATAPDFIEHPYVARSVLVAWGDSFIENTQFMNKLAELTGLYGYNFGKSSQQSTGVLAKQGGAPSYYTPVGGSIPAAGSVVLSPAVPGPLAAFGWAAMSSIPVVYAGVAGLFGWDGAAATFTRTEPGDSIPVPTLTAIDVIPTTTQAVRNGAAAGTVYRQHHECINIFSFGRNNISQTDTIMTNVHQAIARLTPMGIRPLFCSQFPAHDEPTGTSNNAAVLRLNQRLLDEVPEFYTHIDGVDMLQNFKNHHNPNFAEDVADVDSGLTPRTLRYDGLHPAQKVVVGVTGNGNSLSPENALWVGAEVNAQFVFDVMKLKGWINGAG